jgi:hypothetical protein
LGVNDEAVLVLLGKLSGGADHAHAHAAAREFTITVDLVARLRCRIQSPAAVGASLNKLANRPLPEIAPRGRHMLHTMNSTNAMPIRSTKKATESYSSQCRLTVIISFHPVHTPFFLVPRIDGRCHTRGEH